MTRRKGFTLVEILVVINHHPPLLVVAAGGADQQPESIGPATPRRRRPSSCSTKAARSTTSTSASIANDKQDSRSLHHHLGMPRKLATQKSDTGGTLSPPKPPIIEFQRDMLGDARSGTPRSKTQPRADRRRLRQPRPLQGPRQGYNKRSVDIWSPGKDGKGPASTRICPTMTT